MPPKKKRNESDSSAAVVSNIPEENAPETGNGSSTDFPVVGIGASAGGLHVLKSFFSHMPRQPNMAFVIVQHLDPDHESFMVELLKKSTRMNIVQAKSDMPVDINSVYIIPPNAYMTIEQGKLQLFKPEARRGFRTPIDYFFTSLGEDIGRRAICIILSGTGSDGSLGLRSVKEHNGLVFVQDPETAEYDGMPRSAINTNIVDFILPVEEMPQEIMNVVAHYVHGTIPHKTDVKEDTDVLRSILSVLHARTNHDFRGYKKSTMFRRIQRRMGVKLVNTLEEYLEVIRNDKDEAETLLKDLLIGVSSFFRDRKAWDELKKKVLPHLLSKKGDGSPVRVWVPGCSTGEEAYTLAMIIDEYKQDLGVACDVIVFATDIDKNALESARRGVYSENQLADAPAAYVSRYFETQGAHYRVKERIRSAIVLSVQNVISDPPFSKLDMISCRNLLIYFDNDIQKKIITLFHFALQPQGYLFLGTSESPGQSTMLFRPLSKQWRIYARGNEQTLSAVHIPVLPGAPDHASVKRSDNRILKADSIEEITNRELIRWFSPTAVFVNNDLDIVYYHGDTQKYLNVPRGVPTNNIYQLVQDGLSNLLRGMIHTIRNSTDEKIVRHGQMNRDGHTCMVSVSVIRFSHNEITGYIITFEDVQEQGYDTEKCIDEPHTAVINHLEAELKSAREDLQSTIEELETSNEELKSSNEEVMSMNEELQTSNEELETSKEELQSLNEELSTVNAELQDKVLELEHNTNDLKNIYAGTRIPILILDRQLRIKRISPSISELINITDGDIGRPVTDFTSQFVEQTIIEDTRNVIRSLSTVERFVRTGNDQYYIQRIMPYRTQEDRIDGVIITFSEYTSLHEAGKQMHFQASLIQRVGDAVIATDFDGTIQFWNESAEKLYGWSATAMVGRNLFEFLAAPELTHADTRLPALFNRDTAWDGELKLQRKNGDVFWAEMNNRPYADEHGTMCGIISVSRDISRRKQTEEEIENARALLERQTRTFDEVLSSIQDYLYIFDRKGRFVFANKRLIELWGITAEEAVGKSMADLDYPRDVEQTLRDGIRHVMETGEVVVNETYYTSPAGTAGYFENILVPMFDENGAVIEIAGSSRDVTERKKHQEILRLSEERFRALFSNMTEGFALHEIITDDDGTARNYRFLEVNPAFEKLTGLNRDDLLGKCVLDVLPGTEPSWIENYGEVALTGTPKHFEDYNADLRRWYEVFAYQPAPRQFAVLFADITERKTAEDRIEWIAKFPLSNPHPVMRISAEGELLFANDASRELLDLWHIRVNENVPEHIHGLVLQVLTTSTNIEMEVTIDQTVYALVFADTRLKEYVNIYAHDVTERKNAQTALTVREKQYRELIETANSIIVRWDNRGTIRFMNDFGLDFFGYRAEELIDRDVMTIVPKVEKRSGRDLEAMVRDIAVHPEQYSQVTSENITKTGETRWITWSHKAISDKDGMLLEILAIGNDVTELKHAEAALEKSEQDLAHAQKVGNIGSWRMDVRVNRLYWSDQNYHVFGVPLGTELTYETFLGTIHPDDRAYVDREWAAALEGEPYDIEHRIVRYGEVRWVRERAVIEFDDQGALKGGFGTTQDITKRKNAEEALRESEERLRMVLENSLDGIALTDTATGMDLFVSQALSTLTGFTSDELLSFTEAERRSRVHPDDAEMMVQYYDKVLKDDGFAGALEYRWKIKNGEYRWFSVSFNAIRNNDGKPLYVVGIMRDINENRRMQEKIVQNEILLSKTLEQFPGIVSLWDRKHRLLFANRQWRTIYHVNGRVEGKAITSVYPADDYKVISASFTHATDLHEEQALITRHLTPGGVVIYMRRFIPLGGTRDGGYDVILDIGQEVTEYENTRATLESIRDRLERQVSMSAQELQELNQELNASNTALNKLIEGYKNREEVAQRRIIKSLDTLVLPYLRDLELAVPDGEQTRLVDIIITSINEITMEFGTSLETLGRKLSPTEIKVANLIRNNYETNDIAEILHMEPNTVFSHRRRIRKKLGLSGKDKNLKTYLMSLDEE